MFSDETLVHKMLSKAISIFFLLTGISKVIQNKKNIFLVLSFTTQSCLSIEKRFKTIIKLKPLNLQSIKFKSRGKIYFKKT